MSENPYDILGVSKNASDSEIKTAFNKLAKKHHPDMVGGNKDEFAKINNAYSILKDPEKRKAYDMGGTNEGFSSSSGGFSFDFSGFGDNGFSSFEDIFDIFKPSRRDREIILEITLNEAYRGVTQDIEYVIDEKCNKCSGNGYASNSDLGNCRYCNGRGYTPNGFVRIRCNPCNGSGKKILKPCNECKGNGYSERKKILSVSIPKGIADGEKIRYPGYGGFSKNGSGDLYISIRVKKHRNFTRNGDDLYCKTEVSCIDAMIGKEINIFTILGDRISINIERGTQHGSKIIKKGYGMPNMHGGYGDLYVEINLTVPILNQKQIEIISSLN